MISLDDAHWADGASIEFIAHLLRRPPRAPVLLVTAYRPRYAPSPLLSAFERAERERRAQVVELAPLSAREIDELLTPTVRPHSRNAICQASGGNPFYAKQLARAVDRHRAGGTQASPPLIDLTAPNAVRAALAQEVDDLSAAATGLLRACAVAGDPFELETAFAIAGLPDQEAHRAHDELAEREFVKSTGIPGRYRFRHPIVHTAIYEATGEGWRRRAHARAVTRLAAAGAPPAVLAPHVERSAEVGDLKAVEILRAAGDAAAPRAPDAAARWYRAALRLARAEGAPHADHIGLMLALSAALDAQGRLDESREVLVQVLDQLHADEHHSRTALLARLAHLDAFRGHPQEARSRLAATLNSTAVPAEDQVVLLRELAIDHWRSGDWDVACRYGQEALDAAHAMGDKALVANASAALALAELGKGAPRTAETHRAEALKVFDSLTDEELAPHLDGLAYLAWASGGLGRSHDAIRIAERGLALSRANECAYLFVQFVSVLGNMRMRLGELANAAEHAEDALESALLVGAGPTLVWQLTLHARVAIERDDLDTALREAQEATELGSTVATGLNCWMTPLVLAEAHLATGNPACAHGQLTANRASPVNLPANRATWQLRLLTEAAIDLGRQREAHTWADEAARVARDTASAEAAAEATWTTAMCELVEGRHQQAADHAIDAADRLSSLGLVIDAAKARLVAARALAAGGHVRRAGQTLSEVHGTTRQRGAFRLARIADQARRELEKHHQTPRSATAERTGLDALSTREREIAAHLVRGESNRQIAGELRLSTRTVETHVSRIMAKLGARSRAAVAGIAHDPPIAEPAPSRVPSSNRPRKPCAHCHAPIDASARSDARYCSTRCRQTAWRRAHDGSATATVVPDDG